MMVLPCTPKFGKKARHPIVKAKLAVARQDHQRDRGRQRLGERREVVDGFDFGRRTGRLDRSESERALERDVRAAPHDHRRTGNHPLLDCVVESLLDLTPSQRPILRKFSR